MATVTLIIIMTCCLFLFCFFVSVDTYSDDPYWFSNYTSSFVSLVAEKYGDIVVGKLVYIYLKFFS